MDSSGRALFLYWAVYALDFGTSALFVALGYGSAEANPFQRALLTSPGPGTLLAWVVNQNVWLVLGAAGTLCCLVPRAWLRWSHLGLLLALFSFVRLYGVTTNLGFILQATSGVGLALPAIYAMLSVPVLVAFRGELWGSTSVLAGLRQRSSQARPGA